MLSTYHATQGKSLGRLVFNPTIILLTNHKPADRISGTAEVPPAGVHTAYARLQKSLHKEWAFVQRATPNIGMAFQGVEGKLRDTFLPDLYQRDTSQIPGREITCLPVKQSNRLGLNSLTQLGHQG